MEAGGALLEVGGELGVVFFEAFGEVAGGAEADAVGNLGDGGVGGGEECVGFLQAVDAQDFVGGVVGEGFYLAVELYAAQAETCADLFDCDVGVTDFLLDDGDEPTVEIVLYCHGGIGSGFLYAGGRGLRIIIIIGGGGGLTGRIG